jgi:CRP-like cAMP-binding protein
MKNTDRIVEKLRQFPPLAGEDEYQIRLIAGHVEEHDIKVGDVLLREGDRSVAVHLLITGRAAVSVDGAVIAESGPGSILGEMGLIDHSTSSATVTVIEAGEVLSLDWLGFQALLDSAPVSRAITAGLAERLRRREHTQ